MARDESQEQERDHRKGTNIWKTVHFATLMDLRHLKNSKLEPKRHKYKARVVLQGEVVKDDSGSYAVFQEHGSSASQMTSAKVLDVIARLLGCAGQPSEWVSARTQFRREDVPTFLKLRKSVCFDIWIRLPRHKGAKHLPKHLRTCGFSLKGICTDTPWLDCTGRDSSRRFCSEMDGRKNQPGNACLCIVSKVYPCQCTWTTLKWLR